MRARFVEHSLAIVLLVGPVAHRAAAQERREPPGGELPPYARVPSTPDGEGAFAITGVIDNGLPNIMVTGYWPPTNEMLRQFSPNPDQNIDGWVGENWESRGYNIYAFFPEFPDGFGKGEGDFEVDYQDTSADWWRIIGEVKPFALITFSRAGWDYDWEMEGGNRTYLSSWWTNDYLAPYQPTPELPISDEPHYNERWSSLPIQAIVDAVNVEVPSLYAYIEPIDESRYLSNFIGYHGNWYHDLHSGPCDPLRCVAAGHIHVGYRMDLADAILAAEVTIRTLIDHVDAALPVPGDFDFDGHADLDDFAIIANCLAGPGEQNPSGACTPEQFELIDCDGDSDVDMFDFLAFHAALTGS